MMQSWQLGSIGWGCTEPVIWSTLGTTCGWCHNWVGNPGRPPYVIPRGSAGLKKICWANGLLSLDSCVLIFARVFTKWPFVSIQYLCLEFHQYNSSAKCIWMLDFLTSASLLCMVSRRVVKSKMFVVVVVVAILALQHGTHKETRSPESSGVECVQWKCLLTLHYRLGCYDLITIFGSIWWLEAYPWSVEFYLRRYDESPRDYQSCCCCCCNIFLTSSFFVNKAQILIFSA